MPGKFPEVEKGFLFRCLDLLSQAVRCCEQFVQARQCQVSSFPGQQQVKALLFDLLEARP